MADTEISMEDVNPQDPYDEDIDPVAHEKLLKSIYALDGKKRFQNEVRGAAAPSDNLDLVVYTKKEQAKIQPEDLEVKKRCVSHTLSKPLTELETEKAKRLVAQESMTNDIGKWDPIMQEIRAASQIKFSDRPKGLEMYDVMKPKKFAPRTPLEMEIYEALGKSEDIIDPDQELTQAERNALKAMSIKDARERRKELMKHHELLFRMEIKAKRVKKIKSKSYRRFLRKDKITAEKKQLEEMQKNDPEAFMEKMEQLETARMEERLTLKHRGGGKFARTHKAYSKFDPKTREAVQEMLQKSREITKKRQEAESSEEDDDVEMANTQMIVQSVSDGVDKDEPDDKTTSSKATDLRSKHLEILKTVNKKAGGWLDGSTAYIYTDSQKKTTNFSHQEVENDTEKEEETIAKGKNNENSSGDQSRLVSLDVLDMDDEEDEEILTSHKNMKSSKNKETDDDIFKAVNAKGASLPEVGDHSDHQPPIIKKTRKRARDSDEGDTKMDTDENEEAPKDKSSKKKRKKKKKKGSAETENSEVNKPVQEITLKPSAQEEIDRKDNEEEDEEEDGMRVTMEELFQDEDVVEQFAKDKKELEEQKRPKKEDTRLPGWGHWSGPDYRDKPPEQKRRKKFTKPQNPKSKKDDKPNVWLNPNRNDVIRKFQPKKVPFPYSEVGQYEASMRQPVSRGFVRETAFKALNKPEVVTKLGHIIKPLDKDDFFKKQELDADEDFGKSGSKDQKYSGPIKFRNNRKAVK